MLAKNNPDIQEAVTTISQHFPAIWIYSMHLIIFPCNFQGMQIKAIPPDTSHHTKTPAVILLLLFSCKSLLSDCMAFSILYIRLSLNGFFRSITLPSALPLLDLRLPECRARRAVSRLRCSVLRTSDRMHL